MKPMTLKRRILIVDDDPIYRKSVIALFEDTDLVFLQAGNIRDALTLLHKNPDVRVVILDLKLRKSQGTTLLEAIKDRIENYRVIVLTAHHELLAAREAAAYKVFSYVTKADEKSLREALLFHINDAFAAIENAWLGKRIDAHLEIVRRVNSLGQSGTDDADQELRKVLGLICEHALDLLDAYTCHIRIVDPARGDFVLWASKGKNGDAGNIFEERVPLNKAYSGLAAERKGPINEGRLQEQSAFLDMKAEALARGDLDRGAREYWNTVRAAYVVPLSTGVFGNDIIDSVFNINSEVEDFFLTPERQELVKDFVNQTDLAITKHLLKKKRLDIHDDYRNIGDMLEDISNVFIAGEDELEKIYKIVFERISVGLGPEVISIFLFDDASQLLKNVAEYRGGEWVGPRDEQYARGVGRVGHVYSGGGTMMFARSDESTGPTAGDISPELHADEEQVMNIPSGRLAHYLAVPIKFANATMGVLRAVNKKSADYDSSPEKTGSNCLLKRGFSEDCRTELEITASHLAATIKNAELIGQLNKSVNQLESIYRVGKLIGFRQDMNAAFQLIVQSAVDIMNAEICMLFQMNEKGDRIVLTHSAGMPLKVLPGAFYDVGEGTTGGVAKTGVAVLEKQPNRAHKGKYEDKIVAFLESKPGASKNGIESFMAVPLIAEGRILGVIKVINKVEAPYHFEEKDLHFFQLFDSQIGVERFLYTQKYLKNVVENSPVPIIFLNRNGEVEIFNKACEQLWGHKSEDVKDKSVVELYITEAQARLIGKQLWESDDHQVHHVEALIKDSNGDPIPVVLSAAFLFDEESRRIGSMGVFKDLREIRAYQDQAQRTEDQAERTEWEANIGRLADIVSHTTKTSIATAQFDFDSLKEKTDKLGITEFTSLYTHIEDALTEALDNLKSLTRSPQPNAPVTEVLSVETLFTSSIFETLAREADRSAVRFELNYSTVPRTSVALDFDQIREVIKYLFNNSLDAIRKRRAASGSETPGLIEVTATGADHRLELIWKDNGCGIPAETIGRIFELYFTEGKREGTGLGLYRVQKIIENHGGKVSVESVEGEGATLVVSLPVRRL
jgi:PAS domain S-box-containing protein